MYWSRTCRASFVVLCGVCLSGGREFSIYQGFCWNLVVYLLRSFCLYSKVNLVQMAYNAISEDLKSTLLYVRSEHHTYHSHSYENS